MALRCTYYGTLNRHTPTCFDEHFLSLQKITILRHVVHPHNFILYTSMNCDSKREIDKILKSNNHYEVLGLQRNATKQEIKQAYKTSALKYHPDKSSLPQAKEIFHKVTTAYEQLYNDEKKINFDSFCKKNQYSYQDPKRSGSRGENNQKKESFRSAGERRDYHQKSKTSEKKAEKPDYSKYFKPPPNPYNPKRSEPPSYERESSSKESKSFEEAQIRKRQHLKFRHSNRSWISILLTFLMFFLFWKFVPDFTSRQPKFLFSKTPPYSLKVKTSRYKFPYYIKPQHLDATVLLDSKVQQIHLRKLENDCQSALNLKEKYEKLILNDPTHLQFWHQQMQAVNYQSCKKILKLVKKYPELQLNYFAHLIK